MKRKYVLCIGAIAVLVLAVVIICFDLYDIKGRKVITVGAFTGSYWDVQNGNSYKILESAIEKFEEQYPEIKVEFESGITHDDYSDWLCSRILEGNAPDIFFVFDEDFDLLSELGALKDLSRLSGNDSEFNKEDFYASSYSCGTYKGVQYALPYESAVNLMFVNKSILYEEGISLPESDWDWNDFYNICQAVTADKDGDGLTDRFGVCNYNWEEAMISNGVRIFDDEGNVTDLSSDGAAETVAFIEKLEELNKGRSVTSNDFDKGNVAFQPLMFSQYRAYKPYPLRVKKFSGFEWDCVTMPAGPKGKNTSYTDTLLLAINSKTHNEKYAWELMKILTCDEDIQSQIFRYSEGASPLKRVTNSPEIISYLEEEGNINLSLLNRAMEDATVMPSFKNYDSAVGMIDMAISDILAGDSNISMSLIKSQRDINTNLRNEDRRK